MALVLLAFGVFIVGAALVFGAYHLVTRLPQYLTERRIQQRIDDVAHHLEPQQAEAFNLVKQQVAGVLPGLDKLATDTAYGSSLSRLVEQAGSKMGVSTIILLSLVLGVCVGFLTSAVTRESWALVPGFGLGAEEVEVINDSELVARQIGGEYKVKHAGLKPLFAEAMRS